MLDVLRHGKGDVPVAFQMVELCPKPFGFHRVEDEDGDVSFGKGASGHKRGIASEQEIPWNLGETE